MKHQTLSVLALLVVSQWKNTSANVEAQLSSFADDLAATMYTEVSNDCTSSLGVSMIFDLIYPSASGESKAQMEIQFGFVDPVLHWEASDFSTIYGGACNVRERCDPIVSIANRIWVNNQVSLDTDYAAVVEKFSQEIDFADASAPDTINGWVEEATNGLIDSIVDEVNPDWVILAVNSIYLKANWRVPFETRFTTTEAFGDSEAHFMHAVGYWDYSATAVPDHQMIKLDFYGGSDATRGLSMVLVVPTTMDTLPSVSLTEVIGALPSLEETRVGLGLPKFKFDATYSDALRTTLMSLGLTAPFEGGLCIIEGSCDSSIGFIVQKTSIDVNEDGVEAAAVTALGVAVSIDLTAPHAMIIDRPFQFWILHNQVALFEGRVLDPGVPSGTVAVDGLTHSADRFWQDNFFVNDPILVALKEPTAGTEPVESPTETGADEESPATSSEPETAAPSGTKSSVFSLQTPLWRVVGTVGEIMAFFLLAL